MCSKFRKTTYLVIFILTLSFSFPVNAFAKWKDRSDELPGMTSTEKVVLYAVGAAAVATLVILIAKSSGGKKDNQKSEVVEPDSASTTTSLNSQGFSLTTIRTAPVMAFEEPSVLPYVALQSAPVLTGYANNKKYDSFVLGVSVKF